MLQTIRRFAVVLLIVLSPSAAHCNPVVGPEVSICPTFSAAQGNQEGVEIAASPFGYLAVWQDTRGGQADVFGCRISPTGEVLDLAAIPIDQCASDQLDPAVAWNGTQYLVVWCDRRLSAQHIYCARVQLDGQVIDKQGMLLSGTVGSQAYPRVASDGHGWQVVWQDSRGGSQDIYGCRVSGDGAVGKVMGIVTLPSNNEETPDIAYNGSTFVVIWRDQRNSSATDAEIYGCRVAKNGLRMGSDVLISCDATGASGVVGAQSNPRVSACGANSLVVWEDYRGDGVTCDIYGARLNSTGTVMDRNGIAIATGTGNQELPSVSFDGTRLLVAWRERSNRWVRGARVSTDGAVLDPSGFNISLGVAGSAGISVCGYPGAGFWVGWNSLTMGGNDALIAHVPGSGTFGGSAGALISLAQDDQPTYSVADNGTEYAVVWSQEVNGKSSILGAKVSHSGVLLTSTAVNLTGASMGYQTKPSIAWNGTEYLVAWCGNETFDTTNLDIRGYRLDSALHVKDAAPIEICAASEAQTTPYVASNGSKFLVAYEDSRNALAPNYYTDLYGAVVDANGGVTAIASGISLAAGDQRNPRIASNGTDYYVVWEDYRSGLPLIYGVKVTTAGSVVSAVGTAMPATSTYQTTPSICFGGGNYTVTWSDSYRICGCRVSSAGTIVDTSGISIDSGLTTKSAPAAWYDGSQYQVVWEDYRSQFAGNSDIYYTTLGTGGSVSSDPKTALVSDLATQQTPKVFGNTGSGVLFYSCYLAYSHGLRLTPLTQQGIQQVRNISDAKKMPSGSLIVLRGKVVTATLPDCFYAEEVDRSCAIKVLSTVIVHVGDLVDVTGVIGTCDGERQLATGSVVVMGVAAEPVGPMGIRGDWLGGAALSAIAPGVTGANGANNIGLLVKTWGKVSSTGSGYFYIDSKPGVSIKVKSGSLLLPKVGDLVSVTGISTGEVASGAICRAILPRQQSDIALLH
jgi:hypothetical protein